MGFDSDTEETCDVPVLLITWRRPTTTRRVIQALRQVAPKQVFVASDGPRTPGEACSVQTTRELIDSEIDWPCQLHTRFSKVNQGCQQGVSSAITWFFDHVDEGIILEDDCVPHADFFQFSAQMLKRYRLDTRVWSISASNYQDGQCRGNYSYYFSRFMLCWGWATWKRCWTHYSEHSKVWHEISQSESLQQSMFADPVERAYWMKMWHRVIDQGCPDSWAYRWQLVCMANRGLTVIPNSNLAENIGVGADSMHTAGMKMPSLSSDRFKPSSEIPSCILNDFDADRYAFDHYFDGIDARLNSKFYFRIWQKIKITLLNPFYYPRKAVKLVSLFANHLSGSR